MLRYCQTLEVHTDFATLYLRGTLGSSDVELVRAMCTQLPSTIRVLRLDASGLDRLDPEVRDSLNALVEEWRAVRNGQVIVAGSRRETVVGTPRVSTEATPTQPGSALMATFL